MRGSALDRARALDDHWEVIDFPHSVLREDMIVLLRLIEIIADERDEALAERDRMSDAYYTAIDYWNT